MGGIGSLGQHLALGTDAGMTGVAQHGFVGKLTDQDKLVYALFCSSRGREVTVADWSEGTRKMGT